MILEHEIPEGSKLHFGVSARLKRKVEDLSVSLFYKNGFEEIISPTFVYQEHQKSFLNRNVIQLSSEKNHQISMRSDSTIDAIRIITKRLGRSTTQKKWFYIQPVFSYPTTEYNQIGAECIDEIEHTKVIELGINIFRELQISPILQITNARIAIKCAEQTGIDYKYFSKLDIEKLQNIDFISKLLMVSSIDSLRDFLPSCPKFLYEEIEYLIYLCECNYDNILCSPFLPVPVDYYDGLFFRMFINNFTFLSGGMSCIDDIKSCGFGIYTDNVVYYLLKQNNQNKEV